MGDAWSALCRSSTENGRLMGCPVVLAPGGGLSRNGRVRSRRVDPYRNGASRSGSSLCVDYEDPEQTPDCFDVTAVTIPEDVQPGSCVRTVASLDGRLLRIETLDRRCRAPNR